MRASLREEGVPDNLIDLSRTWVAEDEDGIAGFWSFYGNERQILLGHFLVMKDRRHSPVSTDVCLSCLDKVKELGFSQLFVHTPYEYVARFIERTFKTKPYEKKGPYWFFVLEV